MTCGLNYFISCKYKSGLKAETYLLNFKGSYVHAFCSSCGFNYTLNIENKSIARWH